MIWFNEERGAGFISAEDGARLAVRGTDFVSGVPPQGRCGGLPVTFQLDSSGEEPRAVDVRLEDDIAPRRARRRGSLR